MSQPGSWRLRVGLVTLATRIVAEGAARVIWAGVRHGADWTHPKGRSAPPRPAGVYLPQVELRTVRVWTGTCDGCDSRTVLGYKGNPAPTHCAGCGRPLADLEVADYECEWVIHRNRAGDIACPVCNSGTCPGRDQLARCTTR